MTKLRIIYSETGWIRFISHRDLMRIFFRAFRRAALPMEYSRGFNPHPRVEFCPPLPVGMEGRAEIIDLRLAEELPVSEVLSRLNDSTLPRGIALREIISLTEETPSLGKTIAAAEYRVSPPAGTPISPAGIADLLSRKSIPWERLRKDRVREIDLRPGILSLRREEEADKPALFLALSLRHPAPRPGEVLACLSGRTPEELRGSKWRRLSFRGEDPVRNILYSP